MDALMERTRIVVKQYMPIGEFADFMQIGSRKTLSDYFLNETEPFYRR
jgi:hypothetical protein